MVNCSDAARARSSGLSARRKTSATAIQACFIRGSVFGSPGVTDGVGALEVVGGGGGELGAAVDGAVDGSVGGGGGGVGDGDGGAGAVRAQTLSDTGPVSPPRVTLIRKQASASAGSPVTVVELRAPSSWFTWVTLASLAGSTRCRL